MTSVSVINTDAIYRRTVAYLFEDEPSGLSMFPLVGPQSGGTRVTIDGHHFSAQLASFCRFDDLPVPANYISQTRIECITPPHPVGFSSLLLTTNDQNYFDDGVSFEFQPAASIIMLAPAQGPVAGGTNTILIGAGFAQRSAQLGYLMCRFNYTATLA
eukprot:3074383-Prymnesium_polylepis.1